MTKVFFMKKKRYLIQVLLWLLSPLCLASLDFRLPAVLSENMVLQSSTTSRVWGWGAEGSRIDVLFKTNSGETVKSTGIVSDKGVFSLALDLSEHAGKVGVLEFSCQGQLLKSLGNVLVGDVWLASGQSNMAFKMSKTQTAKADIAAADYPQIRFFYVPRSAHHKNQNDYRAVAPLTPRWLVCKPENAAHFSAVAYHFAHDIHLSQKLPVGIVECSWGGSLCEAWLSPEVLESDPELKGFYQEWRQGYEAYYKENKESKFDLIDNQLSKLRRKGGEHPVNLKGLSWDYTPQHRPGHLYNAMYFPISKLSLRGVIWYQGESNARSFKHIARYSSAFSALVKEYRKNSGNEKLPIFWVNLAGFEPSKKHSETWPAIREVQSQLTRIPHTGQAVALDIGSKKNVHPGNKKTVGERLALCARAVAYREGLAYRGPQLKELVFQGNKAVLSFGQLGQEKLIIKGEPFFEMAGEDNVFYPAQWTQSAFDEVTLSCDKVKKPQSIRYNWRGFPSGHLYNQSGLPAASLRAQNNNLKSSGADKQNK